MPTYFFNVRGADIEASDLTGRLCRDDAAARAEAEAMAAELAEAARVAGAPPPDAVIEVDDEELRPLLALPVAQSGG